MDNTNVACGVPFGGKCGKVDEVESDDEEENIADGTTKTTLERRAPSADSVLDLTVFINNAQLPFSAFRAKYLEKAPDDAASEPPKTTAIHDDEPAPPDSGTLPLIAIAVAPKARRRPDLKVTIPDRCTDPTAPASPKTAPVQLPAVGRTQTVGAATKVPPHTPGEATPKRRSARPPRLDLIDVGVDRTVDWKTWQPRPPQIRAQHCECECRSKSAHMYKQPAQTPSPGAMRRRARPKSADSRVDVTKLQ